MENFATSGTKMIETVFSGRKNLRINIYIYIYSIGIGKALEMFKTTNSISC